MKLKQLEELKQECLSCQKCQLGKTRINVVFSDGNPETAKAILIGEAPGENEDKTGTPFVGRAGKLLNEFLEKAGISRKKDLYIINTVKCRPPKNRVPMDTEKKACEEGTQKVHVHQRCNKKISSKSSSCACIDRVVCFVFWREKLGKSSSLVHGFVEYCVKRQKCRYV